MGRELIYLIHMSSKVLVFSEVNKWRDTTVNYLLAFNWHPRFRITAPPAQYLGALDPTHMENVIKCMRIHPPPQKVNNC